MISDDVFHYLQALKDANTDIAFISSSTPPLPVSTLHKALDWASCAITRPNEGYDFGSWKAGIDHLGDVTSGYRRILFANDSVYGPLVPLAPLLELWDQVGTEVMALTESYERQYHLQSYFWGVKGSALEGGFFDYFWRRHYRPAKSRNDAIKRFELFIHEAACAQFGLTAAPLFKLQDLTTFNAANNPTKFNPMHHGALELVTDHQFPFLKREFIDRNPYNLASVDAAKRLLRAR
ncbi:rhamnan synthesis F family protein [Marinobacter sp. C2H3]|uniref:rhamnan synthesis F family protein n=1 Tax=Marinobacter sp. C2H3 TaxID=3119003 RepID=UPI00300EE3A0